MLCNRSLDYRWFRRVDNFPNDRSARAVEFPKSHISQKSIDRLGILTHHADHCTQPGSIVPTAHKSMPDVFTLAGVCNDG